MSPSIPLLIARLRAAGITLRADNGQLKIAAPKGALDDASKALLREHKPEVLAWLAQLDTASVAAIEGVERDAGAPVPATLGQQQLWLLDRQGRGAAYHIAAGLLLDGELDTEALGAALARALEQHAALRTRLVERDGSLWQDIESTCPPLECDADADTDPSALLQRFADAGFDLARHAPARFKLVRRGPRAHLLLVCVHHSAIDGWGLSLLLEQLSRDYAALVQGRPLAAPARGPSMADVALWQQRQDAEGRHAAALAYWQEQLADAPQPLRLGESADWRAGHYCFEVAPALAQALQRLAADSRITLYHWLLASYKLLLAKYGGQRTVALIVPVANREAGGLEELVGMLTNTVPSVSRIDSAMSMRDLARRESDATLAALAHHAAPFERVLQHCRAQGTPVPADLMFSLQTVSELDLQLPGLHSSLLRYLPAQAKFDLTLTLEQRGAGLSGVLEYRSALLPPARAEALAQAYLYLLEQVVRDPERSLGEFALAAPAPYTGPAAGAPHVIGQIAAQVRRTPHAPALVQGARTLSYAQMWRAVGVAAAQLRAAGVGPGGHVGVLLAPGPQLVVAALAAHCVGAAYAPLDIHQPPERLAMMVEDARLHAVFAAPGSTPLGAAVWLAPAGDGEAAAGQDAPVVPYEGPADLPAYLIFTSGSTGRPKPTRVHQLGLTQLVQWYRQLCLDADPQVRTLVISNPSFDLTQKNMLAPLTCGGTTGFPDAPRFDPAAIAAALQAQDTTLFTCTPTAFQTLLRHCEADGYAALARLRAVVLGGEPVALEPLRRWQRGAVGRSYPVQVINSYGPTECADIVAYEVLPLDLEQASAPVPMGRAVPGCVLEVIDFDGQPLPPGAVGELRIDGDCVGLGYYGRDDLSAQVFREGGRGINGRRYHSGDLVQQQADGRFHYLGRRDQQVKLNGYRIELGEIEAALLAQDGVVHAAVAPRKDGQGNPLLAAFYASASGAALEHGALRQALARKLAPYQVPACYVHLDVMPLTRSGKVDRNALPQELPERGAGDSSAAVAALSGRAQQLAALWTELLGLAHAPRADDDFFALGGHSMLVFDLVRTLRERCALELSVDQVFRHPVLAEMAQAIDTQAHAGAVVRLDEDARAALTPFQRQLWIVYRLHGPSASYNMAAAYRLSGRLDSARLLAALGDVIERHWILRSRLLQDSPGALPLLAVGAAGTVPLRRRTVAAAEVAGAVEAFSGHAFDLAGEALARFELLHVGDDEHYLLANIHHIACDGYSLRTLFHDLAYAYASRSGGTAPWSDRAPLQFAELAATRAQARDPQRYAAALDELAARLRGAANESTLPTDRARAGQSDHGAARCEFALPAPVRAQVAAVAARHATSTFNVMLASWFWLLSRYRRQNDLVLGIPIACRDEAGSDAVIGPLLNTLVVRVDCARARTFDDLVGQTAEAIGFARERREVAFEDLVEALNPPRTPDLSPLFQVQFVMDPVAPEALAIDGVAVRALAPTAIAAKYDLNVHLVDDEGGLRGYIDYRRALYLAPTIDALLAAWQGLIARIGADSGAALAECGLLDSERRQAFDALLVHPDGTLPADLPVHRLFEQQVRRTPAALALDGGAAGSLSYAELDARANQLAHRLIASGVHSGAIVAVLAGRGIGRVVSLLALLKAGAAYLPVDTEWPAQRQQLVLEQSGCALVLADAALAPAHGRMKVLAPWSAADQALPATAPQVAVDAGQPCYLMYTSGSTGVPKGVLIRHGGVSHDLAFLVRKLGLGEGDRVLQLTAFSFDPSVRDLFATLACGATAVLVDDATAKSPAAILDALRLRQVTHLLSMVPTLLRAVLAEAGQAPASASLRVLMLNGERLRGDDCRRALATFGDALRIVNQYGPTEATMTSATHEVSAADLDALTVPLGSANPNTRLYVVDEHGQPLPPGALGEIWIHGPGLAAGYWQRPDLSDAAFVTLRLPGASALPCYRTGDLGRWRGDGVLEFAGRIDFQVKLRGQRIELGEIDVCLGQAEGVGHCACVLYEDEAGRQFLCAFYTVAAGAADPGAARLRAAMAGRLPAAMVPSHYIVLDQLPLTSSGKVDRKRLPSPAAQVAARASAGAALADDLERQIAQVWCDLLGLAQLPSRDANFFELGATSLSMVQARDRLAQRFGEQLSVIDLFQHPSIGALAACLRAAPEAPVVSAPQIDKRRAHLRQRAAQHAPAKAIP